MIRAKDIKDCAQTLFREAGVEVVLLDEEVPT